MEMPSLEKMAAAAEKLTAHAGKPKRRRGKKKTARKSPKRVRAAKKAARTRARKHAVRVRAAKKGARKRTKRLPSLAALSKKHKALLDRKFDLDYRYSVKKTITPKQYHKAFGPLVRAIKKAEAALRGGHFNY